MAKQHTFYPEIFRVGFQFRLDQSNCRHDQEKESKQNNFSTVSLGEPSKSFKKRLQNRPHKQSRPVPPCMALKKKNVSIIIVRISTKNIFTVLPTP